MSKAGIEKWLRQKGIDPDTVDIEGEYDSAESYSWNLKHIKEYLKTGKGRRTQKEYDAKFGSYAGEECLKSDIEACKAACKECGIHCDKAERKRKAPMKKCKAPVRVKKHKRKCPRRATKCKPPVQVRAHKRKCPSILDGISKVIDDLI